ncbi:MAG TPA: SH3 domain-containing protein [Bauldia sp.]|nr:SH3 domain-containing protein [Bauldia sp.]
MRDGAGAGLGWLGKSLAGAVLFGVLAAGGALVMRGERAAASASDEPQVQPGETIGKSGLPLPRFVSLKATGKVNVRVGPGEGYNVAWVFVRPSLPVEIIQEYDSWRRIRDSSGATGWIFHTLLTPKRTAVVEPWASSDPLPIHANADSAASITAYLQPGVQASVDSCRGGWCDLSGTGFSGWIEQNKLWGVYPNEVVD